MSEVGVHARPPSLGLGRGTSDVSSQLPRYLYGLRPTVLRLYTSLRPYLWALRGWLRAVTATGIVVHTLYRVHMTPVLIFSEKFKPPLPHTPRAHT